jgi:hypothetical protein
VYYISAEINKLKCHLVLYVVELAHPVHELVDAVELGPCADAVLLVIAGGRVESRKTVTRLQ